MASNWVDSSQPDKPTSWSYSYDQVGRLTQGVLAAAGDRPQAVFGYQFSANVGCGADDRAGLNGARSGATVRYGVGGVYQSRYCTDYAGRLSEVQGYGGVPASGITYDERGNLTRIGVRSFSYDRNDRVASASAGGQTISYSRDLAGRVVARTDSSGTVGYGFSGGDDAPDFELVSGRFTVKYLPLPGGVVVAKPVAGSARYQIANLHGDTVATVTVSVVTGGFGISEAGWVYDPYGQPLNPDTGRVDTQAVPATRGNGQTDGWLGAHQRAYEHNGAFNHIHMGARIYLPDLGIFTAIDPVPSGNDTPYTYPNDPINKTDITGKAWWDDAGAILGAVSTVACIFGGPGLCLVASSATALWNIGVKGVDIYREGRSIGLADFTDIAIDVASIVVKPLRWGKGIVGARGSGRRFAGEVKSNWFKDAGRWLFPNHKRSQLRTPFYKLGSYIDVAKSVPIRFSVRSGIALLNAIRTDVYLRKRALW